MNKINIYALKEDIFQALAILPITDLNRLFEFNKRYTSDQIILRLVKDTLSKFERNTPLKLTLKLPKVTCIANEQVGDSWVNLYYNAGTGQMIKFYENYDLIFYNLLDESELSLIPIEIKRLQLGLTVDHPSGYRNFKYKRPTLVGNSLNSFNYYSGLFRYPVLTDTRDTDVIKLENSWILFMNDGTDAYRVFKAALIVKICDYIKNMKNNFSLPGIPIDIFGALDDVARPYADLVQTDNNSVNSDLFD